MGKRKIGEETEKGREKNRRGKRRIGRREEYSIR